ncbi:MAG TPA: hypothetical protein VGE74_15380 [Gemmata sp.]
MEQVKDKEEDKLDCTLVPAKLPKWIKQLAVRIGEHTGEDIGEIVARHAKTSIIAEHDQVDASFKNAIANTLEGGK